MGRLTVIRGRTGTGKTQLMKWFAHEMRRTGAIPLYVSLPSFADDPARDIPTYVSTYGGFSNRYRDFGSAATLQHELAEEERTGSLVVLADCPDELCDSELSAVATSLISFNHVVLAERHDALPLDLQGMGVAKMPQLVPQSILALLDRTGVHGKLSYEVMDEIRHFGLLGNVAAVFGIARVPPTPGPALQVRLGVEHWIDQRLKVTRQAAGHANLTFVARKLLEILALMELGLEGPENGSARLSCRRSEYAIRRLDTWATREDGIQALSFLCRTGLINPRENASIFCYPGLCPLIAQGTHSERFSGRFSSHRND